MAMSDVPKIADTGSQPSRSAKWWRSLLARLAETWTCAREHQLQDSGFGSGPRVVRDLSELWGFSSLTLRELAQIIVGNELLVFFPGSHYWLG